MFRVALGTLRTRTGGILGALVGVTIAISLVVSSGIVLESTLRAEIPAERLTEAAIIVHRGQSFRPEGGEAVDALGEQTRFDGRVARRLAALPGVASAIPDRTFATEVADATGRSLGPTNGDDLPGHGWSSAALAGRVIASGRPPRNSGEIVLDRELASSGSARLGSRVRVETAFGEGVFSVAGIAAPRRGHSGSVPAGVYFRDDVATRLAGTGEDVALVGIMLRDGTSGAEVAERVRLVGRPARPARPHRCEAWGGRVARIRPEP